MATFCKYLQNNYYALPVVDSDSVSWLMKRGNRSKSVSEVHLPASWSYRLFLFDCINKYTMKSTSTSSNCITEYIIIIFSWVEAAENKKSHSRFCLVDNRWTSQHWPHTVPTTIEPLIRSSKRQVAFFSSTGMRPKWIKPQNYCNVKLTLNVNLQKISSMHRCTPLLGSTLEAPYWKKEMPWDTVPEMFKSFLSFCCKTHSKLLKCSPDKAFIFFI